MDRTSISRRIGSIKGDIEKLSNTLCAIEKTDIENYPENYAMLTTDAALRSELIACRMRHLLYGSTTTRKETYLASAGVVQGIRIQTQENMLEITLPCLLPKRKQRQSTEFLIDPLYFTLSQYSDNNGLPKFRQCVVCFSHIYSEKFHNRRVRDYDNLELKQLLDVLSTQKSPSHSRRAFAYFFGNVTVMLVPFPRVLWRSILPPWYWTACLTIDRPRPVPPEALEWLLSTR